MQTTYDIFVNSSAIKMKIAGKLVDDTEQVSGKTKLLGVKREQNLPWLKLMKERKLSILGHSYACDFVTPMHKWRRKWSESKPVLKRIYWYPFYFDTESTMKTTSSYVRSMTVLKNAALQHLGP